MICIVLWMVILVCAVEWLRVKLGKWWEDGKF